MSMKPLCDKCDKPIEQTGEERSEMPDLLVLMDGETVLEYQDLCPTCEERVSSNIGRYLAVGTRTRKSAE